MGPAERKNGRWKRLDFSKPHRTHTQRFPWQYSRLQFHCKQIHSTAALSLLSLLHQGHLPEHQPCTKFHWSTGRNSASSRCATSSLSISEFCSNNSSANLTLVRLKLWSSVNLMRFCQSSANLVTSLPASGVWIFHHFPSPAFSLGQYRHPQALP